MESHQKINHEPRLTIQVDARMIENSGIGIVIQNILSRLIVTHPDCEFCVLLPKSHMGKFDWLEKPNVKKFEWNRKIYSIREHFGKLPTKGMKIDVTWVPHYNVSAAISGPILATVHDILHIEKKIVQRSFVQHLYAKIMLNWVRIRCSAIHFVSKATLDSFQLKIGNVRIQKVIWNGVDNVWFSPVKSNNDLYQTTPYIVFVGNGFPHKNLVRLIRAVGIVRNSFPIELKIIGNFNGLKTIDQDAIRAASDNNQYVELKGKVEFGELRKLVANAKLLAFPSLYEGFGLPPLEALAVGVPVVVSNIPVHNEIFSEEAHFVDPYSEISIAEGIINAINDTSCKEMRQEFARKFNWDSSADKFYEFIVDMMSVSR